jgi:hypothetical protein
LRVADGVGGVELKIRGSRSELDPRHVHVTCGTSTCLSTYLHHGRPSAFSSLQSTFKTAIPWSIDWCCIRYIFVAELPHSSLVVLCRAGSAEATGHRSLSLMGLSTSYSSLSIPRLLTSPSPWPRRPPRCRHRGSQMSRPATLRCPDPRGGQTPRQCLRCPRWCCRP